VTDISPSCGRRISSRGSGCRLLRRATQPREPLADPGHDPHVPEIPHTREHPEFAGRKSVELSAANLAEYDAVLIATDHDDVDWPHVVTHSKLVVDTRNVCGKIESDKIVRA